MGLRVLQVLHDSNIIVYWLTSHTSKKTQSLDVAVFSPFKGAMSEDVNLTVTRNEADAWDSFHAELCVREGIF